MLQDIVGGYIRHKSDEHAHVLAITSITQLQKVVNIMNGKLRTPKINQFNNLIVWLNEKNSNIRMNNINNSNIVRNAWLSGFIDSDGSFGINIRQKSSERPLRSKNRVEARFRIEQRMIDPLRGQSYYDIINNIATAFNRKVTISKHNVPSTEYYLVSVTSPSKLKKLLDYLNKYPLLTSKNLNFKDFSICVKIMLDKKHLTEEGRNTIIQIKNSINNKRNHSSFNVLYIHSPIIL